MSEQPQTLGGTNPDTSTFSVIGRHWLLIVNVGLGVYVALPVAAPLLKAIGLGVPAQVIYFFYLNFFCHQIFSRHFYLLGNPLAFCQRDLAIYTSMFAGGLLFGLVRRRLPPLPWVAYGILILPMAIDGFTQLFGWRESTWELRLLTGALFGLSSVWLLFPRLNQVLGEIWGNGRD